MNELPEGNWQDAPIRLLGRMPASWWTSNMTLEDCMRIPPSLYSGHLTDPKLLAVFYGAMHGEDIWMKQVPLPDGWTDTFLYQFCTLQLPYFYLNRLHRERAEADGDDYIVHFSDGVVSFGKDSRITKDGAVLKDGDDVLLPLDDDGTVFIAYSKNGRNGDWAIPDAPSKEAQVFEITPDGNVPCGSAMIENGTVMLSVKPGQALAIRF